MSARPAQRRLPSDVPTVLADAERIDPRGAVTWAELSAPGSTWVRIEGAELSVCEVEADRRLPLARALPALRACADVTLLAYRPERRLVLRVRDERGSRVVKGVRPGRLAEIARRHRLAERVWARAPLRAPVLLEVDAERAAFALSDEAGRALDLGRRDEDAFFRLGAGLRALQACDQGARLPVHGPGDELALLDGLSSGVRGLGRALPTGWIALRDALGRACAALPAVEASLCHRDLHDGQVLVAPDDLVVLDFDLLCRADPLLDAANLVVHLKLRELQGLCGADDRTVSTCGGELLEGLDREREAAYRQRLRFYQAATFLRLALLYGLRRRWRHLDRELVSRARRCLDDR